MRVKPRDYINKNKENLIRLDGRKYVGSTDRIVLGALYLLCWVILRAVILPMPLSKLAIASGRSITRSPAKLKRIFMNAFSLGKDIESGNDVQRAASVAFLNYLDERRRIV